MKSIFAFLTAVLTAGAAYAARPVEGALGTQPAATRIMERVEWFHNGYLLPIITIVTVFVMALLLWVMWRYNAKSNPVPRKFSHNTTVEIVWTVVPVLILVAIAGPSFTNLYYQDRAPNLEQVVATGGELRDAGDEAALERFLKNNYPEAAAKGWVNVKAQGNQWNWTYSYPDELDGSGYPVEFVSNPIHVGLSTDPEGTKADPRMLAVDYPMVVPAGRYVRYYTAASDVIHSFAMPSFGIKTDAVPGRLNQGWFLVEEPGVYYGQCSELCGVNHAYMPIEIRVVPEDQYNRWLELMKAGDFDGGRAVVAEIEPLSRETRLASAN
ncbi:MAG: cytochrome c oxidase subunit II [Pseudomonadota bacterium]